MANNDSTVTLEGFLGLNNKEDRWSLNNQWFEQLDDWDVDDAGGLRVRQGITSRLSGYADAYSFEDGSAAFLIDTSNQLVELGDNGITVRVLESDVGSGPYYWTELGRNVYLNGKESSWEIRPDGVYEWGIAPPPQPSLNGGVGLGSLPAGTYQVALTYLRSDGFESGASAPARFTIAADSAIYVNNIVQHSNPEIETVLYVSAPDGKELYMVYKPTGASAIIDGDPNDWSYPLRTLNLYAPPLNAPVCAFDGRVWVAISDSIHGFSRLLASEPLRPGYFQYDPVNPVDIPDSINTVIGTPNGVLVGGTKSIWAVTVSEDGLYSTRQVAHYGCVPSQPDVDEEGRGYIWTKRGLCRGLPFENLTESKLRVDAGDSAACLVRYQGGYRSLLVSPQGSTTTFNPFGTRISPTINTHNLALPHNALPEDPPLAQESGSYLLLEY